MDTRQLYVEKFMKNLEMNISNTGDNQWKKRAQGVCETLTDAFSQSLSSVEERFERYLEQLVNMDEEPTLLMDAMKTILASEKFKPNLIFQRVNRKTSYPRQLHRQALKNCLKQIRDVIDLQTTSVLDSLISKDVVSVSDEESIRGQKNRKRQNEELLCCLAGSLTVEDFHTVLLPALEENYPSVVEALIAEMDRLETVFEEKLCVACRVRRDVQVKRIATSLLTKKHIPCAMFLDLRSTGMSNSSKWAELRSLPDTAIIDALEVRYPDFYKELKALDIPSLDCRCVKGTGMAASDDETATDLDDDDDDDDDDESQLESDEEFNKIEVCYTLCETTETAYNMAARPRGICLIINNTEIKGHLKRLWSNCDKDNLQRVFTKLEFQVMTKNNLTAEEMVSTVEEVAQMDHIKFDAFICCILTYGNEHGVFGCDGKMIKESKLTSPFKASSCHSLAGKPKLFFIVANRTARGRSKPINPSSKNTDFVADDADFLFGYSTLPSKASFPSETGSLYVSALTKILDSHSDRHDLLTCMRMVNQEVSNQAVLYSGSWYDQVPAPVFTLTKDVFLTSSPCWPHLPVV